MRPSKLVGPGLLLARITWAATLTVPGTLLIAMFYMSRWTPPRADVFDARWWGGFEIASIFAVALIPAVFHRWLVSRRDPAVIWTRVHRAAPLRGYRGAPTLRSRLRPEVLEQRCRIYLVRLGLALLCVAPLFWSIYDVAGLFSCKCGADFWLGYRPPEQVAWLSALLVAALAFHVPTRRAVLGPQRVRFAF